MFKCRKLKNRQVHKFSILSSFALLSILLLSSIPMILNSSLLLSVRTQGLSATIDGINSTFFTNNSLSLDQQLSTIPFNEMTNSNAIVTNSLTYENPIYGISIDYPSKWTYQEAQEDSFANTTIFSIVDIAPPISEDPNVVTNFQIGIEDLESPISLDQYVRTVINSYRGNLNFSLISVDDNAMLSGRPAYEIIFTDVTEDGIERKSIERGTIDEANNRVYYLAFITEASMY